MFSQSVFHCSHEESADVDASFQCSVAANEPEYADVITKIAVARAKRLAALLLCFFTSTIFSS